MKKSFLTSLLAAPLLWTLSASAPALAQTCIKTPTCADLGYSQTAADCAGKTILKCPLDTSKLYCPSDTSQKSCPNGYAPYIEVLPYCNESETIRMVQYSNTGCYQCKKCSKGYYFNNKCSSIGEFEDGNGCARCNNCNLHSADLQPVDGWCR